MSTPAPHISQEPKSAARATATRELHISVYVDDEDGRFAAVVPDYSVTGIGATAQEAVQDVVNSLMDYLNWCARDGLTIEQARRPISKRWHAELIAKAQFSRLRSLVARRSESVRREVVSLPDVAACH